MKKQKGTNIKLSYNGLINLLKVNEAITLNID